MSALPQEEFCPRCGRWVTILDDYSGWCTPCATGGEAFTVDSKVCSRCKVCRDVEQFRVAGRYSDGRCSICRPCETAARKQWRVDHPEAEREHALRALARRTRGRCAECGRKANLTVTGGVIVAHKRRLGAPRCAGSGQPPQEAA